MARIKHYLLLSCLIFNTPMFGIQMARAAVTPVSIAIVPPIQFPPDDFMIAGIRASVIWGRHRQVYGLDAGLIGNITDLNFVGIGVSGLFNITNGSTTILGLQLAGALNSNSNKTNVLGLQAALGANRNTATSTVVGLQLAGVANLSEHTTIYGIQASVFNKAQDVYGLQIGVVNVATHLHGIQIGLVNFNAKGPFVVSPVINVGW